LVQKGPIYGEYQIQTCLSQSTSLSWYKSKITNLPPENRLKGKLKQYKVAFPSCYRHLNQASLNTCIYTSANTCIYTRSLPLSIRVYTRALSLSQYIRVYTESERARLISRVVSSAGMACIHTHVIPADETSRRSRSAKEPSIIGLFCRK